MLNLNYGFDVDELDVNLDAKTNPSDVKDEIEVRKNRIIYLIKAVREK